MWRMAAASGIGLALAGQAHAQAAAGGADLMSPIMLAATFVALYFIVMRPQMKKAKEHRQLLAGLQKGDEVVTGAGMLGRVTRVTEDYVGVEIASGVEVVLQKAAVQVVLPKGTIKNAA
jgi:preprotein translocase subunit YajC